MKILSLRLNVSQVLVDFFILFRAYGCVLTKLITLRKIKYYYICLFAQFKSRRVFWSILFQYMSK